MRHTLPDPLLSNLSELLAAQTGLYFPEERWDDLERGISAAAHELGDASMEACARHVLSAPLTHQQIEILASHLTVGETYFFRDQKSFEALEQSVLPELISSRRASGRRLRIWSVGCCTGEEPYSIAMLLDRLLPDHEQWHVTVLATDINPQFLRKAAEGVYGNWSFRGTPAWVKELYFKTGPHGRLEIHPRIKKMVTFSYLNLADDVYPSLSNNTNAMDIIFCRNVLMYFTAELAEKVVGNLYRAVVDGGWLAVSPVEASHTLFSRFSPVHFTDATFYRKAADAALSVPPNGHGRNVTPDDETCHARSPLSNPLPQAGEGVNESLREFHVKFNPIQEESILWELPPGRDRLYRGQEAAPTGAGTKDFRTDARLEVSQTNTLLSNEGLNSAPPDSTTFPATQADRDPTPQPDERELPSRMARSCANQGKLAEAAEWCGKAIALDKLNPKNHYLLATILDELGQADMAEQSLKRALYLEPDFVLAHFALGNLRLSQGRHDEAKRHFGNALALLQKRQLDEILPESDGLTAGRLGEIISSALTTLPRAAEMSA